MSNGKMEWSVDPPYNFLGVKTHLNLLLFLFQFVANEHIIQLKEDLNEMKKNGEDLKKEIETLNEEIE